MGQSSMGINSYFQYCLLTDQDGGKNIYMPSSGLCEDFHLGNDFHMVSDTANGTGSGDIMPKRYTIWNATATETAAETAADFSSAVTGYGVSYIPAGNVYT